MRGTRCDDVMGRRAWRWVWSIAMCLSFTASAQTIGNTPRAGGPHIRPRIQAVPFEAAPAAAPIHMNYYGGRVVSNIEVVQVLWGPGSYLPAVADTCGVGITSFYQSVLNSSYVDWLGEYDTSIRAVNGLAGTRQHIGRGHFAGQYMITPSAANAGARVEDSQIQAELLAQIRAGNLPAPTTDAAGNSNTYYAVFFPPKLKIGFNGMTSCKEFCAYHGTLGNVSGKEAFYGVHPDMQPGSGCAVGCGHSTVFGNYTIVASHEMVETMTDPEVGLAFFIDKPLAWFDPNRGGAGESGDMCLGQETSVAGADGVTYAVQKNWSNAQGKCVAGPAPKQAALTATPSAPASPPGVGVFDFMSAADRAFAFDYTSSGRPDHLAVYRPGSGWFSIVRPGPGAFAAKYPAVAPMHGIGGYDLKSSMDRAFAFDYDSSGFADHIALYRPGTGTFWILKNNSGTFTPVYAQGDPGHGIGGYNLLSPADQAFAFDYDHSGKLDHLVLYRPGTGAIFILKNINGTFVAVYFQGDPGHGIGGYDLRSPNDQAIAIDYEGTGRLDHLALYRPGAGILWVLKNEGGVFAPVFQTNLAKAFDSFDLLSLSDRAIAFDYEGSGKADHLLLYRPGAGRLSIVGRQ